MGGANAGGVAALRDRLGLNNVTGKSSGSSGGLASAIASFKRDLGLNDLMGAVGGGSAVSSGGSVGTSYGQQQAAPSVSYSEPAVSVPSVLQTSSVPSTSPLSMPMQTAPAQQVGELATRQAESKPIQSMPVVGTAASTGKESLKSSGGLKRGAALDAWERMAAEKENRPVRTTNLFGEEYDDEDSFLGTWDNQLDAMGNTPMNDAYLRNAVDNGGLSMDDAWAILHKPTSLQAESEMRSTRNVSPGLYDKKGTVIDDGTSYDYAHMTSNKMTGAQYLKYAEMGMGGRSVDDIDPSKVYDKRQEAVNNGFIPFTPDAATMATSVGDNIIGTPGRLGKMVSGLRETLTPDYGINIGDKKLSGRDFDKKSGTYMDQFDYFSQYDPERYLSPDSKANRGKAVTPHIREFVVPDVDGKDTYHYGDVTKVNEGEDGTIRFDFADGSFVDTNMDSLKSSDRVSITYDGDIPIYSFQDDRVPIDRIHGKMPENLGGLNRNYNELVAMADEYGGSPLDYANVIYIPDLQMSDGQRLSQSDVDRMYSDELGENNRSGKERNSDISYEFSGIGPLSNKPTRLAKQELFGTDDSGNMTADFSDIGNNIVDWTLGSLPISLGAQFGLPWIYSGSNAATSVYGADPNSYDPITNTWGLQAGKYDDEGNLRYGVLDRNYDIDEDLSESTKWWNALGNLAVPLTETIAGPVGKAFIPLEKYANKIPVNSHLGELARDLAIGAIGEGIEEDVGNVFEELTQYGPEGMFAEPIKNANGDDMQDMYGHQVRDTSTPVWQRANNFLNPTDLLNSFAGGVGVDMLLDVVPSIPKIPAAIRADNARRATGVRKFVEPEDLPVDENDERWRHLDLRNLNNEIAR